MKGDVLLAVSNSGGTEEMLALVPWVKRLGSPVVALTGSARSPLAQAADVTSTSRSAPRHAPRPRPHRLDHRRPRHGRRPQHGPPRAARLPVEDFAVLHPGGRLGKKLLRVEDLMHTGDDVPRVGPETPMKDVLFEMTRKRLGLTTVTAEDGTLLGMISDGDLRRQMERHGYALLDRKAAECMTRNPVLVGRRELATTALDVLETRKITSLLVTDATGTSGGRPPPPRPLEDGDDLAGDDGHRARRRLPRHGRGGARGGRVGGRPEARRSGSGRSSGPPRTTPRASTAWPPGSSRPPSTSSARSCATTRTRWRSSRC